MGPTAVMRRRIAFSCIMVCLLLLCGSTFNGMSRTDGCWSSSVIVRAGASSTPPTTARSTTTGQATESPRDAAEGEEGTNANPVDNGNRGETALPILPCFTPRCDAGESFRFRLHHCHSLMNILERFIRRNWNIPTENSYATKQELRSKARRDLRELVSSQLVGQSHLIEPLLKVVTTKLRQPSLPTVLHFVGDNGVGKSFTADLISLALSLRCDENEELQASSGSVRRKKGCSRGDSMLVISCTSYCELPESEISTAVQVLTERIEAHQRSFPHGIVLLDDVNLLPARMLLALSPLLGRGMDFSATKTSSKASTAKPLSNLLVVLTSDLGREGRTLGKSDEEVKEIVRREMTFLYGSLVLSHTHTFVFRSFSTEDAVEMLQLTVKRSPCRHGLSHVLTAASISDTAAHFLVEEWRVEWERGGENARALRRLVEVRLLSQLYNFWEQNGEDTVVEVMFDMSRSSTRNTDVMLFVKESDIGGGSPAARWVEWCEKGSCEDADEKAMHHSAENDNGMNSGDL